MWQLLGRLRAPQLKALTACASFFDLPHVDAPQGGLPPPAVEAMLEVRQLSGRAGSDPACLHAPPIDSRTCHNALQLAADACSNLLYNVSPSDNAAHGRRPAYLFELLRRLAWACRPRRAAGPGGSCRRGAWEGLRAAVAGSPHVAKLLGLWASAQVRRAGRVYSSGGMFVPPAGSCRPTSDALTSPPCALDTLPALLP